MIQVMFEAREIVETPDIMVSIGSLGVLFDLEIKEHDKMIVTLAEEFDYVTGRTYDPFFGMILKNGRVIYEEWLLPVIRRETGVELELRELAEYIFENGIVPIGSDGWRYVDFGEFVAVLGHNNVDFVTTAMLGKDNRKSPFLIKVLENAVSNGFLYMSKFGSRIRIEKQEPVYFILKEIEKVSVAGNRKVIGVIHLTDSNELYKSMQRLYEEQKIYIGNLGYKKINSFNEMEELLIRFDKEGVTYYSFGNYFVFSMNRNKRYILREFFTR